MYILRSDYHYRWRHGLYHAEAHLNGHRVANPQSPEFKQFLLLERALYEMGFYVLRTELCVFHCGLLSDCY